ncbi:MULTISPECIES: ABC transporter permease [Solibacillus]|uniref:ABC transporter permease n=1 Tax=Solibacillus merdavium TaxID=2762218 RepID=A0ABR8XQD3_9BACL|nr:FtsX-like permease family protein [Solibacillus merdavium]MBD8034152.1 ABC transporter permease [Solibacillus merdavium]
MLFKDQIDFVLQHIKKNKLRVFMTVLAATMGCAFLIVLASIGFGLQASMEEEILSNQSVTKIEVMGGDAQFTAEEVAEIESVENVQTVLKTTTMDAEAKSFFEDRETISGVRLTNFTDYASIAKPLAEGTYPKNENEIVVGYHFGQTLLNEADRKLIEEKSKAAEAEGTYYNGEEEGYKSSLIGKEIELAISSHDNPDKLSERMTYTIVGVMPRPGYQWVIENRIYMMDEQRTALENSFKQVMVDDSASDFQLFNERYDIYAKSLEYVKPILEDLRGKGYGVYSVTEQLDELNIFFLVLKVGLIFVGTIAVLIASIGIFNTMTMAVTERTREIGVLKAIGASPKLIQRLFLMESTFIGVIGTVLAIAISYLVSFASNLLLPIVLEAATGEANFSNIQFSAIPWQLVVIAATISIGVAMISGLRPARKATKIEVMQALRQEL